MNKSEDNPNVNLAKMLHGAGIRPSLQRIAVLSIVMNGKRHPSADEVFSEMAEMYPSLSRTTVYNALHSLTNAGLIKELEIESGCMRYDFARQPEHAHFKCRDCGKIFDMAIPDGLRESLSDGFAADSVELSFKGLCPDCKKSECQE
ncbi:MAG: transcriptional repressor [Muribaculaceae bacterium]